MSWVAPRLRKRNWEAAHLERRVRLARVQQIAPNDLALPSVFGQVERQVSQAKDSIWRLDRVVLWRWFQRQLDVVR